VPDVGDDAEKTGGDAGFGYHCGQIVQPDGGIRISGHRVVLPCHSPYQGVFCHPIRSQLRHLGFSRKKKGTGAVSGR